MKTFPLSFGELGQWYQYELAPKAYNSPIGLELSAELEPKSFERIVRIIASRHELLRASFAIESGQLSHLVHESSEVDFVYVDAHDWTDEKLNQEVRAFSQARFYLDKLPLLRVRLFSRSKSKHWLVLNTPHIISDGHSYGLFFSELFKLLAMARDNQELVLPPVTSSYQNYVEWQKELVAGPSGEKFWHYWKTKLSGELPVLDIPYDNYQESRTGDNGARFVFEVPKDLTAGIKALSESRGVTQYSVFLAAYYVFLHGITEQSDFIVGSSMAGEARDQFPSVFGYMVNMVPLRVKLDAKQKLSEVIESVENTVFEALEYQEFPLPLLVQKLHSNKSSDRTPLFQTSFTYHNFDSMFDLRAAEKAGMKARVLPIEQAAGQYDLNLRISEHGSDITFALQYNADVLNAHTIEKFSKVYRDILESFASSSDPSLSEVSGRLDFKRGSRTTKKVEKEKPGTREHVEPRNEIEQKLAKIWKETLGIEKIGVFDRLMDSGGDSIIALQFIMRANEAGVSLSLKQIFQYQTIAELAQVAKVSSISSEQGLVSGEVKLTPIQHWFFGQNPPDPQYYVLVVKLEAQSELDPYLLERAAWYLVSHHDALRIKYVKEGNEWRQFTGELEDSIPLIELDLSAVPAADQLDHRDEQLKKISAEINLADGPLVKVVLCSYGDVRPQQVICLFHHLVTDVVSMGILANDFVTVYDQLNAGNEVKLPAKTTSYQRWASKLIDYAGDGIAKDEVGYWLEQSKTWVNSPMAFDNPKGKNDIESSVNFWKALDPKYTELLLREVPKAYQTQINDVLLAALTLAYNRWTGNSDLLVDLEGHGREPILEDEDIFRTVGWFTTIQPIQFSLVKADGIGGIINSVKKKLREMPNHGIGYGILRYLSPDDSIRNALATSPKADIRFNYVGQLDQMSPDSKQAQSLRPYFEDKKQAMYRSPKANLTHSIIMHPRTASGEFQLEIIYSKDRFKPETIDRLADIYLEELRAIVDHCIRLTKAGGAQ